MIKSLVRAGRSTLPGWIVAWVAGACAQTPNHVPPSGGGWTVATERRLFRAETSWDDGLAEMSYYRAEETIYHEVRRYTRVVIVNREWFGPVDGVKVEPPTETAIPVLKLNMAEEIPTENYNYRYLTTLFTRRDDLRPLKMVVSSQEWCGAAYKHLRWSGEGLKVESFSYLSGDRSWTVEPDAVPYEALFLLARDVASSGKSLPLRVLPPMRTPQSVQPASVDAVLAPGPPTALFVPAGMFRGVPVTLTWNGPATLFMVDERAPYHVLKYECGSAKGELQAVESRAYWDRKWKSKAYETGSAP